MLTLQQLCVVSIEKQLLPIEIVLWYCVSRLHDVGDCVPSMRPVSRTLISQWYDTFGLTVTTQQCNDILDSMIAPSSFKDGVQLLSIDWDAPEFSMKDYQYVERLIRRPITTIGFPQEIKNLIFDTNVSTAMLKSIDLDLDVFRSGNAKSYVYWHERLLKENGRFDLNLMFHCLRLKRRNMIAECKRETQFRSKRQTKFRILNR